MTRDEHEKLGKTLWAIANKLRGAMNADDFRDYMLCFLFLRNISDTYQAAAKEELGADYPPVNGHITPLQRWYEENNDELSISAFADMMRQKVHYVIHPDYLWDNIAAMARRQDSDLLRTLLKGFKYIEEESFGSAFRGLFSEINLESDKIGKDYRQRNERLCTIIATIADGLADFTTDQDMLGDAYEYLIGQFAAGSGKKAGEFYTPQHISTILSRIVTLDSQYPSQNIKDYLGTVLDFACGSGSLLLNVRKQCSGGIGKIYGQENNITTYNLARMNMLLHGVKDSAFEIFHGDTLKNEWPLMREANPARRIYFDAIVANPPFSLRWDQTDAPDDDPRFKDYGIAPKSAADFAFLLHGFHYLKDEGTMAIILPHGVLFRGSTEGRIRQKLLKDNNIDAVIGLPSNLFYSTGIPVCIVVLKKCKKDDDVLFINASEHFAKGKRQNSLRRQDIDTIVNTYRQRAEQPRYSRRVPMQEIVENDYNLNISRYVSTAAPEQPVDLHAVHNELQQLQHTIDAARATHNAFLKELGLPELPGGSSTAHD